MLPVCFSAHSVVWCVLNVPSNRIYSNTIPYFLHCQGNTMST
uniref:Uncharacterized protein n=1 Tax=Anguilla anguilla TaxID=7936 RepID=A0A0E9VJ57_ANGAN